MKQINERKLNKAIRQHEVWLSSHGRKGSRLILINYDLSYKDLSNSNLSNSNLSNSYLAFSDLSNSNLSNSNLSNSNLYKSNLSYSDLSHSDLSYSGLYKSNLSYSDLAGSNLSNSNLSYGIIISNIKGKTIKTFNGPKNFAYYCDGLVKIGCEQHSLSYWLENYKLIGKDNNYSLEEIKEYGEWLNSLI